MSAFEKFADREEAGRKLAELLESRNFPAPVVLALPRGGVPVAAEVARALGAPLDLLLVSKIGVPSQRELAAAAVIDGDTPEIVINEEVFALAGLSERYIEAAAQEELAEIERRREIYLKGRPRAEIENRTAIVVDDGIATGTTIRAVIKALRRRGPKSVVLAVPVAPPDTVEALRRESDEVVCLQMPEPFFAVGIYYEDFHQVDDDEVIALLAQSPAPEMPPAEPTRRLKKQGAGKRKSKRR